MIVFNGNAVIQAIILALLGLLGYFLGIERFFDSFGDKSGSIVGFYCIYAILYSTEIMGIKGKLFWIPTWFLWLVFIFLFNLGYQSYFDPEDNLFNKIFHICNYFIPILLFYGMIRKLHNQFVSNFKNAHLVLANINKTDAWYENNKKQFWIELSHAFVRPGFVFLQFYPLYRFLFGNVITQEAFLEHYENLIALIKKRMTTSMNVAELNAFSMDIDNFKQTKSYSHSSGNLNAVAKVIDAENQMRS